MLFNLVTNWQWKGELPKVFGWYHIMWIVIMIIVTIVLCKFVASKHDKKKDDIVIFSIGTLLILIEIYKQVFYTLDAGHYQWYAFPYQFCSAPMYVAFIAPLLKEGKVKNAMYMFIAFFGLLAGTSVMIYPGGVFATSYITILIHTMIWHSSMVVMGVYIIYSRRIGKNYLKEIIPGAITFFVIVMIALVGNILSYKLYFSNPELNIYGEHLNMFYISPYYQSSLPIFSIIWTKVPYPIFLASYFAAFFLGVSLIWLIIKGIRDIKFVIMKQRRKHIKISYEH